MRLILVRHGETASNVERLLDTGHPGAPLNDRGLDQAAAVVERLAGEPVEAVFSSDLVRAHQTATPLAEKLGLQVTPLAAFREIFAGDDDMSEDWQPYVDVLTAWFTDPTAKLANGESWLEFEQRWDSGVQAVEDTGVDCAVVVSHGAALRVWVPYAATNLDTGAAASWPLHNTGIIVLDGSVAEGWQVVEWSDVTLPA